MRYMATRPFSPKAGTVDLVDVPETVLPVNRSVVLQRGREVAAFLLFTAALFLLLALFTYRRDPGDPLVEGANWVGPVGSTVASWLVQGFGCVALLVPLELGLVGLPLFRGQEVGPWGLRVAGDLMVAIVAAALVQVLWPDATHFGAMPASGNVGMLFGELMRGMFSTPGSILVGFTIIGLVLLGRSAFSFIEWCQRTVEFSLRVLSWCKVVSARIVRAWLEARRLNRAQTAPVSPAPVMVATHLSEEAIIAKLEDNDDDFFPFDKTGAPPIAVMQSLRVGLSLATSALAESETPMAVPVAVKLRTLVDAEGLPAVEMQNAPARIVLGKPQPKSDPNAERYCDDANVAFDEEGDDCTPSSPAVREKAARIVIAKPQSKRAPIATDEDEDEGSDEDEDEGSDEDEDEGSDEDEDEGSDEGSDEDEDEDEDEVSDEGSDEESDEDENEGSGEDEDEESDEDEDEESGEDEDEESGEDENEGSGEDEDEGPDADEDGDEADSGVRPKTKDAAKSKANARLAARATPPGDNSTKPGRTKATPSANSSTKPGRRKVLSSGDVSMSASTVDVPQANEPLSAGARKAEERRNIANSKLAVSTPKQTQFERPATGAAAIAAALVNNADLASRSDSRTLAAGAGAPATGAKEGAPPLLTPPKKRRKFKLPSTELLGKASGNEPKIDTDRVLAHAGRLEKTLLDYGVMGKVEEIHPGPTVTTYEFAPQAGTKVSKVSGLADDLALGLSRKVRIIAPIPGKSRIGFELPNDQRIPVNLRELVEDPRFAALSEKVPLPVVMGRDIVGAPFYADLASLPHVIVAGATGAGKSVGLNVMLASLLFKRTPDELRMLMIDPKVVELAPFDKIPHLLLPVVTDMKQANLALKWAVDEMERRYQLFATAGTKNIGTYNRWAERVAAGELPPPPPAAVEALSADGAVITVPATQDGSDGSNLPGKLPYIVIVIDEFADLIMQQGKEVEASVARLAQKARAAGLHVILATQRPSVDVITGMIKANFPSRVSYLVAQKVDSRTILDEQGAELLLGRGDMLVKLNGSNDVKRVQCPFISEDEVSGLTDYLRTQGQPNYHEVILQQDDEGDGEAEEEALDARFEEAVRIVAETGRCSTSWLQRKMTIGYNRAAKIVEAMERRGMVGPPNGAKDREVLILAH